MVNNTKYRRAVKENAIKKYKLGLVIIRSQVTFSRTILLERRSRNSMTLVIIINNY
jgi:hypothetical protein